MAVATLPSLPPTTAADQAGPPPTGTDPGAVGGEDRAGAFTNVLGALADGSADNAATGAQDGLITSASEGDTSQGPESLLDPLLAAQMAEIWGLGTPAAPAATSEAATGGGALAQPFVILFAPAAGTAGNAGSTDSPDPTTAPAWPWGDALATGTSATDPTTLDPLRVIAAYTEAPALAAPLAGAADQSAVSADLPTTLPVDPFPAPADGPDTPASFQALGQVIPALLTARQATAIEVSTAASTAATATAASTATALPAASAVPAAPVPTTDGSDSATAVATAALPAAAKRPGRMPDAASPGHADSGTAATTATTTLVADTGTAAIDDPFPEHRSASEPSAPASGSATPAPPAPGADPASSAAAVLHHSAPDAGGIATAPGGATSATEPSPAAATTAATATAAPAAAPAAASVPAQPARPPGEANPMEKAIVNQVSRQLVRTDANGDRSLVIRLTPPELGTVRIELREHDGVLTAHLRTEDEAVGRAIDRLLPQLRSDLRGSDSAVTEVVRERGQGQDGADERRGSSADQQAPWQRQRERDDNRSDRQRDGAPAFSLDLPRDPDTGTAPATPRPAPVRRADATGVDALA